MDSSGNAYVTGAGVIPTTPGAFQTTCSIVTGACAFVTKLNQAGTALVYSTYLDGSRIDQGQGIAVDSAGNAYVTGVTNSTDFPTTVGAFQTTKTTGGSLVDAFVTKLNPTGTALVYSTYLGGSGPDQGQGIAVDSAGNAYVTGATESPNFPTTTGVFQPTFGGLVGGSSDAFVTKLNPIGTALVYSTYLGGISTDDGLAIAVDSAGNAYVTGVTSSTDFPTTVGAYQTTLGGFGSNAFVAKIGAGISDLSSLVNSFNLPAGTANSLLAKLGDAQASLATGDLTGACNQLNAFIHDVQAQSGKKITVDQANALIALANGVKASLGCP